MYVKMKNLAAKARTRFRFSYFDLQIEKKRTSSACNMLESDPRRVLFRRFFACALASARGNAVYQHVHRKHGRVGLSALPDHGVAYGNTVTGCKLVQFALKVPALMLAGAVEKAAKF